MSGKGKPKATAKSKGKAKAKPPSDDVDSKATAEKVLKSAGVPKELIGRLEKDEVTFYALANALKEVAEQDRELRAIVNELADVAPEITKLEETVESMKGKVKAAQNELDLAYKREHEAVKKLRAVKSGEYQQTLGFAGGKTAAAKGKAIKEAAEKLDGALRVLTGEVLMGEVGEMISRDECEALADLFVDPKVQKSGIVPGRVAKSLWKSSTAKAKAKALDVLDRLTARGWLVEVQGSGGRVEFHLKPNMKADAATEPKAPPAPAAEPEKTEAPAPEPAASAAAEAPATT